MASRISSRSISRGGTQDHSSTHSQSQSSSRSSTHSNSRSSSNSSSRSSHSETTKPEDTVTITRGPDVKTEVVSGSETTTTRHEDISVGVRFQMPVKTGIYFP